MARTKPWELSDAMWERAQPLLPEPSPIRKAGTRAAMTGSCWMPSSRCCTWASSGTPCRARSAPRPRDRFRAWERAAREGW
jgi:hypothetical protein